MNRTPEQNKRYWALVQLLADKDVQGQKYTKDEWHNYLRCRFLGAKEVKLPGKMPNKEIAALLQNLDTGRTLIIPTETHNLDVAEFGEYLDQVQAWAAEHDVFLDS